MTDEMYGMIVDHIRDEIGDVAAYREMCDAAGGYTRDVLRHIVLDEESHARYLAHALKKCGREMPADVWEMYSEMERSFRRYG